MKWTVHTLKVGMPHMVPNQLSEVELMKVFGDYQWLATAEALQTPASRIVNDFNERLYASFITVQTSVRPRDLVTLGEDATIHCLHSMRVYAEKFLEGFVVFDNQPIDESLLENVESLEDLERLNLPWAYLTNAFVARRASNTRLSVFSPTGMRDADAPRTDVAPPGISQHQAVQETGELELGLEHDRRELKVRDDTPIVYSVTPESDFNGAGLLYFARYVAIMNYGLRVHLARRVATPLSEPLITWLTPQVRKIFYFANAAPGDRVIVDVRTSVGPAKGASRTLLYPFGVEARIDLRRESDGVLMASGVLWSIVAIPKKIKSLAAEAKRFLRGQRVE